MKSLSGVGDLAVPLAAVPPIAPLSPPPQRQGAHPNPGETPFAPALPRSGGNPAKVVATRGGLGPDNGTVFGDLQTFTLCLHFFCHVYILFMWFLVNLRRKGSVGILEGVPI